MPLPARSRSSIFDYFIETIAATSKCLWFIGETSDFTDSLQFVDTKVLPHEFHWLWYSGRPSSLNKYLICDTTEVKWRKVVRTSRYRNKKMFYISTIYEWISYTIFFYFMLLLLSICPNLDLIFLNFSPNSATYFQSY